MTHRPRKTVVVIGNGMVGQRFVEKLVEFDLMGQIPEADWTLFSHRLIFHGRRVCDARKPDCPGCAMNRFCPKVGVNVKPAV